MALSRLLGHPHCIHKRTAALHNEVSWLFYSTNSGEGVRRGRQRRETMPFSIPSC